MSHFAKIENGKVTEVIVAEQDHIDTLEGTWVKTSYNTVNNTHKNGEEPLRGNFAGIGFNYDSENNVFYSDSPFESWKLNKTTWTWEAPTPLPSDAYTGTPEKVYSWDEPTLSWKEIK
jgi:hypothetical protein